MKKYLTLLAGAMLLTACSNEAEDIASNDGYQPSTDAIAFEMAEEGVENSVTRASGVIFNDDELTTKGIGVFATYTGKLKFENTTVMPDFMWNQKVTGSGTAPNITWSYAPVKYWPNALADTPEYVSFFAYAPHTETPTDNGDGGVIDLSANDVNGDPWVNFRIAKYPWDDWDFSDPDENNWVKKNEANQTDLLYGTRRIGDTAPYTYEPWTNVTNWDNETTPTSKLINHKVKFTMKHALASIGNEITIQTNDELNSLIKDYSEIYIYGIKIEYKNLTTKGRLNLNSADGTANWKEIISGELTTDRTYLNMFKTADVLTFEGTSTDAVHIPYLNAATGAGGVPEEASTEGDGLLYIPMQIAGTEKAVAKVTLYYRVKILASGVFMPLMTEKPAEASATFDLTIADTSGNTVEGKKQAIHLTLGKDYDLMHEVWLLGGTATEPSYSRITK